MTSAYNDYHPEWLPKKLNWADFPWNQAVRGSFKTFLDQYTLHDSNWISLFFDPGQSAEAILVIRFDSFWTDGRVPFRSSLVASWPILIAHLSHVREVQFQGFNGDWSPRTISIAESQLGSEADSTSLTDVFNGTVTIRHGRDVEFLCLSSEGQVLSLPWID